MAIVCPTCQNANPDSAAFCQSCGTRLAAPAAVAPATAPQYAAPSYAPPVGANVQVHRSSSLALIAVVTGVISLVGLGGAVGALASTRTPTTHETDRETASPPASIPPPASTGLVIAPSPVATAAPTAAATAARTATPAPTAARTATPAPTAAPATARPAQTPVPGSLTTTTFSLVPGTFTVAKKDDTSMILSGKYGKVSVVSQRASPPTTLDELFDDIISTVKEDAPKLDPKADQCVKFKPSQIGGVSGALVGWSYQLKVQGAATLLVCDVWWGAVNSNGTAVYLYRQVAADADFDKMEAEAVKLRASIVWKLP